MGSLTGSGAKNQVSPALARPAPASAAYFWLVLFFVVYCARPEDWIPGLSVIPLAKITGLFALGAFVLGIGQERRRLPREMVFLSLLLVQLCLTVPFAYWRGGALEQVLNFAKVVLILFIMVRAVTTPERLRRLIFVQASCVAIVAAATVIKGRRLAVGRLDVFLGGIYSNPNDLAFAVVLAFPLCFAFLLRTHRLHVKAVWALAMMVMSYALLQTASRAGILAFVLAMAVCLWEFGVKGRRRYLILLTGVLAVSLLVLYGGRLKDRFDAIIDPDMTSDADIAAQGSFEQRWTLLKKSLALTAEHPFFGVGPGNFETLSGIWRVTHNSYTQMSSEGGLPALAFYLMILWCAFRNVRRSKEVLREQGELTLFAGALHASLVGYAVGSFFASVAYNYFPYFLVGYTTALWRITQDRATFVREPAGPKRGRDSRLEVSGTRSSKATAGAVP